MQLGQGLSLHRGGFRKPFGMDDVNNQELYLTPDDSTTLNAKMCADFVSTNSEYLSVTTNDFNRYGTDEWSVTFWINSTTLNTGVFQYGNIHLFMLTAELELRLYTDGLNYLRLRRLGVFATSTWKCITITSSGGTSLASHGVKLYVNGTELAFTTISEAGTYAGISDGTGSTFYLGLESIRGYLNSKIDAFGFYSVELTDAEQTSIYNSDNGVSISDTVTRGLISWYELNEQSGTRADAYGSNDLSDNNTVGFALGKVQEPIANNEYVWRSVDQSPNAYNIDQGTAASQALYSSTLNAFTFDGVDDYMDITSVLTGGLSNDTTGSWACWVRPTDATPAGNRQIITVGDANDDDLITFQIQATTGKLRAWVWNNGSVRWDLSTNTSPFSDNTWCHVALVQDGVSPVLYVNGVAVAQTFTTSTDKLDWCNDLVDLDVMRIGCSNYFNLGNSEFFEGSIADVLITSDVLSADEVSNIYNLKLSTYS